ncbi:MAG: HPr(Ser) kinase/phosphatase [Firmicutes bacterium]|nr:HPr(Ser) kinase/phosphatase [Bacillota bacterium]
MYSVPMTKMVEELELESFLPEIDLSNRTVVRSEICRPSLQLAGFYEYFDSKRVLIMGRMEFAYLMQMSEEQRKKSLETLFAFNVPCLVICKGLMPLYEMMELAKRYDVPLFGSNYGTSEFAAELIRWLNSELAERITLHGVLVDIYGEGTLLMGDSGIGKSETALELIKRGHRLVADDAVEIKRISHKVLVGSSPELIRYFIELRGIGIVNVKELFGVGAIKLSHNIDLVIKLEKWDSTHEYDRLGLENEYEDILGNKVTCNRIPVLPGRNLAVICEAAAINNRQRRLGYNAAKAFCEHWDQHRK